MKAKKTTLEMSSLEKTMQSGKIALAVFMALELALIFVALLDIISLLQKPV